MIHYILFRTQSHVTEDVARVREALAHVLPPDTPLEEEETKGYFDNPIFILRARLEKKAAIKYMDFLKTKLHESDMSELIKELPERITEDCDLFLKLSKQDAFLGEFRTSYAQDVIALRARVEAYPAKKEIALKRMEEYFHAP
jgi:RNA-binding protein